MASTEGDRGKGDPASGGKDVCRRGWAGAAELFDALRRLFGALTSSVDDRFLLGSWAGDGPGGEVAEGEPAFGEAIAVAVAVATQGFDECLPRVEFGGFPLSCRAQHANNKP